MTQPRSTTPVPSPDPARMPASMVVTTDDGVRIHYLDWGGPASDPTVAFGPPGPELPPLILVHGIGQTGWTWAPVARRLCGETWVVAVDLRGHGASDQPRTGYSLASLAYDVLTVASANGWGAGVGGPPVVLAGHGAGAMVAATAGALSPVGVRGVALVDGGWETLLDATGMSAPQVVAALAEPPEVLASMDAYLADRRGYDPATWDDDQERAARAQVDQKHAGHVAPMVRPATLRALVEAMDAYRPEAAVGNLAGPLRVLIAESGAADDDRIRERRLALDELERLRAAHGHMPAVITRLRSVGHNLMRYRPDEVSAELRALLEAAAG